MIANWWEAGRTPFLATNEHKDYSGRDFDALYHVDSDTLSHSFLNGASIHNCSFVNVELDHSELAEARISASSFHKVNLSASDFVRTEIDNTKFELCDFSNGDWRETRFVSVRFLNCTFSHTTINLCIFEHCEFAFEDRNGLDHRSINYNTFSKCTFTDTIKDELVLSRNFGLPSPPHAQSTFVFGSPTTIELVCRLSSTGQITVSDIIDAIEQECALQRERLKKIRLEFISNIISTLAKDRRISPTSLVYLEGIFMSLVKSAQDEADFLASMGALVNLRNAVFAIANRAIGMPPSAQAPCESIVLAFRQMYSNDEVAVLANALSEVIFGARGDVRISSVSYGSTIIDYILVSSTTVVSVLAALNLILTQANICLKKIEDLGRRMRKL
jgi:uncharacterized protein YjbI with pentapeptide repeats